MKGFIICLAILTPTLFLSAGQINMPDDGSIPILLSAPNPPVSGFSPANSEEVATLLPRVSWDPAVDPDDDPAHLRYICEIGMMDLAAGFLVFETDTTGMGITWVDVRDSLPENAPIYYHLMTLDDEGEESLWSEYQIFYTNSQNEQPWLFQVYSPSADARVIDYNTLFYWDSAYDEDPFTYITYSIETSESEDFSQIHSVVSGITDLYAYIPTDSLGPVGNLYWRVIATDDDGLRRIGCIPEGPRRITILAAGDANTDGTANGLDVLFLVNYFRGYGPEPDPLQAGDANGNCTTNGIDVTYLVNFLKGRGDAPVRGNCDR
jgi:hypothetical protein